MSLTLRTGLVASTGPNWTRSTRPNQAAMELFLDPGDHRSLTLQLYDQLREAIADGRLPTGAR